MSADYGLIGARHGTVAGAVADDRGRYETQQLLSLTLSGFGIVHSVAVLSQKRGKLVNRSKPASAHYSKSHFVADIHQCRQYSGAGITS